MSPTCWERYLFDCNELIRTRVQCLVHSPERATKHNQPPMLYITSLDLIAHWHIHLVILCFCQHIPSANLSLHVVPLRPIGCGWYSARAHVKCPLFNDLSLAFTSLLFEMIVRCKWKKPRKSVSTIVYCPIEEMSEKWWSFCFRTKFGDLLCFLHSNTPACHHTTTTTITIIVTIAWYLAEQHCHG